MLNSSLAAECALDALEEATDRLRVEALRCAQRRDAKAISDEAVAALVACERIALALQSNSAVEAREIVEVDHRITGLEAATLLNGAKPDVHATSAIADCRDRFARFFESLDELDGARCDRDPTTH